MWLHVLKRYIGCNYLLIYKSVVYIYTVDEVVAYLRSLFRSASSVEGKINQYSYSPYCSGGIRHQVLGCKALSSFIRPKGYVMGGASGLE